MNNSNEYLDGDAFLRKMRTELIRNSQGEVEFLDRAIIDQIEKEKRDKERGKRTASSDEIPLGADFFLTGTIDSIDKSAGIALKGPGHQCCNGLCDHGPHVVLGGKCMCPPTPGTE